MDFLRRYAAGQKKEGTNALVFLLMLCLLPVPVRGQSKIFRYSSQPGEIDLRYLQVIGDHGFKPFSPATQGLHDVASASGLVPCVAVPYGFSKPYPDGSIQITKPVFLFRSGKSNYILIFLFPLWNLQDSKPIFTRLQRTKGKVTYLQNSRNSHK